MVGDGGYVIILPIVACGIKQAKKWVTYLCVFPSCPSRQGVKVSP